MSDLASHTAVIRSVTARVAGDVHTEAFAHHYGTSSQQVGVRAGDTLTYVHTREVAATVARAFTDVAHVAERHDLDERVSLSSVGAVVGTYPLGLVQRLAEPPVTAVGFQVRREISGAHVPAHVWVRVGPVLWQVCDRAALDRLTEVWTRCTQLLSSPTDPVVATPVEPAAPTAVELAADGRAAKDGGPGGEAGVRSGPGDARGDVRADAALLRAYVDGDPVAFAVLYRRHEATVLAAARRVFEGRDGAEDAAQITWGLVARRAATFRGEAKVSTWLYRIAHNESVDLARKMRQWASAEATAEQDAGPVPEHAAPVEGAVVRVDTEVTVQRLLDQLPEQQRRAVELVDLQGLDLAEASARCGVAVGTLKSRRARARRRMAAEAERLGLHHFLLD